MIGLLLAGLLSQDVFGDGVVGPGGTTLYLTAPEGGIDVVDAATGKVLKHFETSGRPIALAGEKLLVETLEKTSALLRILELDGKVLFTSKPVEFPDWAYTGSGHAGRSFSSRARADGTSVHYDWFADKRWVGGTPTSSADRERERRNASGRVSIDVGTYALSQGPVPGEKVAAAKELWGGRIEVGGRGYWVETKQDTQGGRPRDARTLKSDAGWSRPLTPRFHAELPQSAPR